MAGCRTRPLRSHRVWISRAMLERDLNAALVFRVLLQLPKPVALSHRRWPLVLNLLVIGAITAWIAVFIHGVYYRRGLINPVGVLMEFVISALAYAFGLVMIV